jgi:hypothetical protein
LYPNHQGCTRLGRLLVQLEHMMFNDIAVFAVVAIAMSWSFALGFYVLFSHTVTEEGVLVAEEYANIQNSFSTVLQMLLAEYDYGTYQGAGDRMALFWCVMIFHGIVLVNLLIAMMGSTYDAIREKAHQHLQLRFAHKVLRYELLYETEMYHFAGTGIAHVIYEDKSSENGLPDFVYEEVVNA